MDKNLHFGYTTENIVNDIKTLIKKKFKLKEILM